MDDKVKWDIYDQGPPQVPPDASDDQVNALYKAWNEKIYEGEDRPTGGSS